uniref:Uncharacterized protein n=1 Tax=Anopheles quadriannulatus TaxID=34691 RepID=A0A182XSC3_ANOQN
MRVSLYLGNNIPPARGATAAAEQRFLGVANNSKDLHDCGQCYN